VEPSFQRGGSPPPLEVFQPGVGWVRVERPRPRRPRFALLRRFPVTAAIGLAILVLYALQHGLARGPDWSWVIIRLGAVRSDLVLEEGELYRLITAAFLHGGLLHIGLNGLAFVQLSLLCEHIYGSWRLLVVYFLSAIGGTLCSATFMPMPSVGASGAILGLAGLLLGTSWFGQDRWRAELRRLLGRRLLYGVLLTFALGLGIQLFWIPIIDNVGHLGGLLTGLAAAAVYRWPDRPPGPATRSLGAGLTLVAAAAFGWMAVDGGEAAERVYADTFDVLEAQLEEAGGSYGAEVAAQLADLYRMAGRDRELERVYARWLDLAPDDPRVKNDLAWFLLTRPRAERRDPARAVDLAAEAVAAVEAELQQLPAWRPWRRSELRLHRVIFLDTLAKALRDAGRVEEAERKDAELRLLADALGPASPNALHVLATSYRRSGERQQALQPAKRLVRVAPRLGVPLWGELVLEARPDDVEALESVLLRLRGLREAFEDEMRAETSLLYRPEYADLLAVEARLLEALGRPAEAVAPAAQALALTPAEATEKRAERVELAGRVRTAAGAAGAGE